MASNAMTPERLAAGADYLAALRKFGLEPDVLAWVLNRETQDFSLVLISTLVDRVGPNAVYETLFKAYDAAVTPKSIDPWIVDLHGQGTVLARELLEWAKPMMDGNYVVFSPEGVPRDKDEDSDWELPIGINIRPAWVYAAKARPPVAMVQIRNWNRFSQVVERAAA